MKISDFRLSEYFIRKFCSTFGLNFSNLEILFTDHLGLHGNAIHLIGNEDYKLSQTIYQIVSIYLENIEIISKAEIDLKKQFDHKSIDIPKEAKTKFINIVLALVRDMSYGDEKFSFNKLNNLPVIWVLIRDIICPAFKRCPNNIDILIQNTPYIDGAKYFADLKDQPVIVLNSTVKNPNYQLGFLLIESIIAQNLNPNEVIYKLIYEAELKDRFMGFLELTHLDESEISDFVSLISSLVKINPPQESQIKVAQSIGQTWWYIGLIEKMLEPSRGSDWSIYFETKNDHQELWNKIEDRKKKLGLNQLPFEELLRLQSEDFKTDPTQSIQGLLSDVRVW